MKLGAALGSAAGIRAGGRGEAVPLYVACGAAAGRLVGVLTRRAVLGRLRGGQER